MRRYSVRSLMVLILGAGVGLAALRNAHLNWAVIKMLNAFLAVVGTSVSLALLAGLAGTLAEKIFDARRKRSETHTPQRPRRVV